LDREGNGLQTVKNGKKSRFGNDAWESKSDDPTLRACKIKGTDRWVEKSTSTEGKTVTIGRGRPGRRRQKAREGEGVLKRKKVCKGRGGKGERLVPLPKTRKSFGKKNSRGRRDEKLKLERREVANIQGIRQPA